MDHLEPFQSGLRPGYRTKTVLVALVNPWREGDEDGGTILDLLDLSAAVDHSILVGWLQDLGQDGKALHWFGSFLQRWSQLTLIGSKRASLRILLKKQ